MIADLRYAIRVLLKSPGFTVVAVLSLALGIGANAAIFTLVHAVFLKPLPVQDPARLVSVYTTDAKNAGLLATSYPNFQDYRDKNTVFSALVAHQNVPLNLSTGSSDPEQLLGEIVSGNYFSALGVEPRPGRAFLPEEDQVPGRNAVVVLSHQLWTRRFGADRTLIGGTINLNGLAFTVVGVAPEGFRGTNVFANTELWTPMMMHAAVFPLESMFNERRGLWFNVTGRLKPGLEIGAARAEMESLAGELAREYPAPNQGRTVRLQRLTESAVPPFLRGRMTQASALLMTIVGVVLLIACANIANLLLARASTRRKEVAVRAALGSGRTRLIRQLLTESIVLALAGGVAGLLVGATAKDLLWSMRPPFLQQSGLDISMDPAVIAFTLGLALITGLLFGLAPALQASRLDLATELNERTNQNAHGGRWGLRDVLVVAQVAMSLVSLAGAGLFLISLRNAERIGPGFEASHLMVLAVSPGRQGYTQPQALEFYRRARERVASLPGVRAAAFAERQFAGPGLLRSVFPEGAEQTADNRGILVGMQSVGAGYFDTLRLPLLRGRDFRDSDREGAALVAIVNETMAARFWPNQDAVGKRFKFFGDPQFREIIAVVKTANYNAIGEDPAMFAYLPVEQFYAPAMTLHVRGTGDPATLTGLVRREVQLFDSNLPITNIFTLPQLIDRSLWAAKMGAGLLAVFGLLALTLASVGLYGVMAYSVSQRTGEIGIRMALGARPSDVVRIILGQAITRVGSGLLIGVLLALGAARPIGSMLWGVSPHDPVTFVLAAGVLAMVAAVASLVPARRAMRVDPLVALRAE